MSCFILPAKNDASFIGDLNNGHLNHRRRGRGGRGIISFSYYFSNTVIQRINPAIKILGLNLKVLDSNSETMEWDLRNGGKLLLLYSQRHAKTLTKPKGVFLPHGQFWMIGRFFCFPKLLFWIICTLANLVEGGRWPLASRGAFHELI